jgi:phosphate:Na+ symporter
MLDDRFLSTPLVALEQCKTAILNMADIASKNVKVVSKMLAAFSAEDAAIVIENESKLDMLDDKISKYIVKLKNLPAREDKGVSKYLHTIRDFERIGDHAENTASILIKMNENEIGFSDDGRKELGILAQAVEDILDLTMRVMTSSDNSAENVEPLEEAIGSLRLAFKERHIARLKQDGCSVEAAVSYNDIATDFERIAAHCSNIALYAIETIYESENRKFEAHSYSRKVRESEGFIRQYNAYKDKYLNMLKS